MNTNPARAPLVATNPEDASAMMTSEGGPAQPAEPDSNSLAACCTWSGLRATIDKHPLSTLAAAFSVGLLAGLCTSH